MDVDEDLLLTRSGLPAQKEVITITPRNVGWTNNSRMHCTHNNALYHMMKSDARSITTSHASGAASSIDNENSMRDIRRHVWKIYRVINSCCVVMVLCSILLSSLLSIVEEEEDGVDSNGCFWLMNFVAATAKANTMRSNIFSQQRQLHSSSNLTFHSALSLSLIMHH